jgi:hypothetical protein
LTTLILLGITFWLVAAWLDKKHQWRFISWMNGECTNPFIPSSEQVRNAALIEKDKTIDELKERIQVLEKIVTEPAYELNKKINQL